jgi:hypothetical protein
MPPSPGLAAGFRRGRASQPDPAFPQSPGFIPGPALSCLTRSSDVRQDVSIEVEGHDRIEAFRICDKV